MSQYNWREKILGHLRYARQWLERAENDFSRDDTLRGELNLALVEAEVRHAWEMSAGKLCQQEAPKRSRRGWVLGLALGVLVLVVVFWQLGSRPQVVQQTPKNPPAVDRQEAQPLPQSPKPSPSAPTPSVKKEQTKVAAASKESPALPQIEEPAGAGPQRAESQQKVQVKVVEAPVEPVAVEKLKREPATVEHNLGELTQLAREVLYAKTDS